MPLPSLSGEKNRNLLSETQGFLTHGMIWFESDFQKEDLPLLALITQTVRRTSVFC
jgi:hypothetical protein